MGVVFCKKTRGMFSIIILDNKKNKYFASEIEAKNHCSIQNMAMV